MLSGVEKVQLEHGNDAEGKLVIIHNQPIMECALDILPELVQHKLVTLKAHGDSIPTAVAVANVITENMMKGNSKIVNIDVDSESSDGKFGPLVSIIKITIAKTN